MNFKELALKVSILNFKSIELMKSKTIMITKWLQPSKVPYHGAAFYIFKGIIELERARKIRLVAIPRTSDPLVKVNPT